MARKVLAAANNKEQKYFMEEEFKFLPDAIKDDLKKICIMMAEKLNCTFMVGFDEGDFDFDEIGAELEIKRLQKEELELFRAMELWYVIFFTKEGELAKQELMHRAAAEGKTL